MVPRLGSVVKKEPGKLLFGMDTRRNSGKFSAVIKALALASQSDDRVPLWLPGPVGTPALPALSGRVAASPPVYRCVPALRWLEVLAAAAVPSLARRASRVAAPVGGASPRMGPGFA